MEVDFTQNASFMIYAMLKNPGVFGQGAVQPYKAADHPAANQVMSLLKFIDEKLTEKPTETTVKFKPWKGKIKQGMIVRLKDIAKHFESVGMQSTNCQAYMELTYALDGKDVNADLESATEDDEPAK